MAPTNFDGAFPLVFLFHNQHVAALQFLNFLRRDEELFRQLLREGEGLLGYHDFGGYSLVEQGDAGHDAHLRMVLMEEKRHPNKDLIKRRFLIGVVEHDAGIGVSDLAVIDIIRLILHMLRIRVEIQHGLHGRMRVLDECTLYLFSVSAVPVDVQLIHKMLFVLQDIHIVRIAVGSRQEFCNIHI